MRDWISFEKESKRFRMTVLRERYLSVCSEGVREKGKGEKGVSSGVGGSSSWVCCAHCVVICDFEDKPLSRWMCLD
jgi:hypothetical protein